MLCAIACWNRWSTPVNFVLRAFAADNDDGDVDDDGDDEGHVEALVAHLWNLLCPLHTA